jgi:hypothetical protein
VINWRSSVHSGQCRSPIPTGSCRGSSSTQAGKDRKRGSKNKTTADARAVAQGYIAEAILTLVALVRGKKTPRQTRAYAASAILDRGHGRPPHAHTGESGTGPVTV